MSTDRPDPTINNLIREIMVFMANYYVINGSVNMPQKFSMSTEPQPLISKAKVMIHIKEDRIPYVHIIISIFDDVDLIEDRETAYLLGRVVINIRKSIDPKVFIDYLHDTMIENCITKQANIERRI